MSFAKKKYLRTLGVFAVTVDGTGENEWQGKHYINVIFKDALNRYIDARWEKRILMPNAVLTSPSDQFKHKQFKQLLELLGAKRLAELEGKKLAVLVEPFHYKSRKPGEEGQDAIGWSVGKFYNLSDLDAGIDSLGAGSDLGFL